jgi:hypothetical protein
MPMVDAEADYGIRQFWGVVRSSCLEVDINETVSYNIDGDNDDIDDYNDNSSDSNGDSNDSNVAEIDDIYFGDVD